jgi:hypothetical protein
MIGGTALQMAPLPTEADAFVHNPQSEIFKLIDELAWEGADTADAKKLVESALSSPELSTATVGEMAIAAYQSEEVTTMSFTSCEDAVFELTIDIIGLIMTLAGVPSKIGKRAAKKIAKKARKRLTKEVIRIAKKYFRDASNLPNIAAGIFEFMSALTSILSVGEIISSVTGEMSYWEIITTGTFIIANITLLFATNVGGVITKLALVTPDIVDVVGSTVSVVNNCD